MTFDGGGASSITFVYAIPTDKQGPLSSCMFFFSLVNLLEHAQAITRVGFRLAPLQDRIRIYRGRMIFARMLVGDRYMQEVNRSYTVHPM